MARRLSALPWLLSLTGCSLLAPLDELSAGRDAATPIADATPAPDAAPAADAALPPCENGVGDGRESSVDCGGPDCRPCRLFERCNTDLDCQNGLTCWGGRCYQRCGRCGGESSACPRCGVGQACTADLDCQTGLCDPGSRTCVCDERWLATVVVGTSTYCAMITEVARTDYRAFLDFMQGFEEEYQRDQPSSCFWNDSFLPDSSTTSLGLGPERFWPITGVDWCDAQAFCGMYGARLCGSPEGGPVPEPSVYFATALSAWYVACTGDGRAYPYGDTYEPGTCNGDGALGTPEAVIREPNPCLSPHGSRDMSGNVAEWEDACDEGSGPAVECLVRGGSFASTPDLLACDRAQVATRGLRSPEIGLRCCTGFKAPE